MVKIIETNGAEETLRVGQSLGEAARPGQVFCLDGDLGVGKTVLAKGFALGCGITEAVVSPTFTIIQEYDSGRIPLYHFDIYRIEEEEELDEIGYEEYFYGDGVCLVEWADMFPEIIPENAVKIRIEKDLSKGFDYRRITLTDGE